MDKFGKKGYNIYIICKKGDKMLNLKRLVLGPLSTNCYVLWDDVDKTGIIIDPADDKEKIIKCLDREKIKVKYIILTHTHYDHINAVRDIKKYTGAAVAVHRLDAAGLTDPTVSLSAYTGYGNPQTKADILLEDGDELTAGVITAKIIHTPGHTVGGIGVLAGNILFSGDTLFRRDIGRCDLPGGNFATLIESIKEKFLPLPEDTHVYPGHGMSTTIKAEKELNEYLK